MSNKAFLILLLGLLSNVVMVQGAERESAWEAMLSRNPELADDVGVDWLDRLILQALTPEQAEEYYQGANPEDLTLADGKSLADYMAAKLSPAGSVYVPLPTHCRLFEYESTLEMPSEDLILRARGTDLKIQGGAAAGCGIPDEAVAVVLQIQALSGEGFIPRLKIWATDAPEPAATFFAGEPNLSDGHGTMALVPLCVTQSCGKGDFQISSANFTQIAGEAVGYFRPLSATDYAGGLGGGVSFYTEGGTDANNFFGGGAGASNVTGVKNSFFGEFAGYTNEGGHWNTALGMEALRNSDASWNTAVGNASLFSNLSGEKNTALGQAALYSNTAGSTNTAVGQEAGYHATGDSNTFVGSLAGYGDTPGLENSGSFNAFFGSGAGYHNTSGSNNVFCGYWSGYQNISASYNTFAGEFSGFSNTIGQYNAYFGFEAGFMNSSGYRNAYFGSEAGRQATGGYNTFSGYQAGYGATSGVSNTGWRNCFFGHQTGYNNTSGSDNSFFGKHAGYSNTEGQYNTYLGQEAGQYATTGSSNTFVGESAGRGNPDPANTGGGNCFFGSEAGRFNSSGGHNSFFGDGSGYYNTSGQLNASFGSLAGSHLTTEQKNTLLGTYSDLEAGAAVENATAVGYAAYVSQPHSLVLGSIGGVNGGPADVNVGIGTTAPESPLHVKRTDGTAKIYVEEASTTSGMRKLLELRNKGIPFFSINNLDSAEWYFMSDGLGNFSISEVGSGVTEFALNGLHLTISGTLLENSDRTTKTSIERVDAQQVLEKLMHLPISEWSRREDSEGVRHMGPMAQDFYEVFKLGPDERKIATIDTSGVALAAIQGLYQEVREKDVRIQQLEREVTEIEELKQELSEIRAILAER